MKGIDLGLVPVQGEDNLPQVTLEIISHGIPILTSDRGGAQELAANPDFTFPAAAHASFNEVLRRLVEGELTLASFWENTMDLRSMAAHLEELTALYRAPPGTPVHPNVTVDPAPSSTAAAETIASTEELFAALPATALANRIAPHA